jgi:uncharacterized protein (DUF305 family)
MSATTSAAEVRKSNPALFQSKTEKEAEELAQKIAESWNAESDEVKEMYKSSERKYDIPAYSFTAANKPNAK